MFDVSRDGKHVTTLFSEKRTYNAGGMPMTEAAIKSMFTGDLYVSLGEPVAAGAWSVRVYSQAVRDLDLGRLRASWRSADCLQCRTVVIG